MEIKALLVVNIEIRKITLKANKNLIFEVLFTKCPDELYNFAI